MTQEESLSEILKARYAANEAHRLALEELKVRLNDRRKEQIIECVTIGGCAFMFCAALVLGCAVSPSPIVVSYT